MGDGKQTILTIVIVLMIIAIFGVPISEKMGSIPILGDMGKLSSGIAEYVFGIDATTGQGLGLSAYAIIVTYLMLWLIIFVTFGDIIETFSSFDPTIAWTIAFCLSTIMAMVGGIRGGVLTMTTWFIWAGTAAVYVALGFAFVLFLLVETGIAPVANWAKKNMQNKTSAKAEIKTMKAASMIKNLNKIEDSLSE